MQRDTGKNLEGSRDVPGAAHRTIILLLMLKRIRVYRVISSVHHVVVHAGVAQERVAVGCDLERLITAAGCYDSVRTGNCWDNVLDDSLGHAVGYSVNVEFLGAGSGFVEEPGDVFWVIGIEGNVFAFLLPRDDVRPFDAVLRLPGNSGECTERYCSAGRVHV